MCICAQVVLLSGRVSRPTGLNGEQGGGHREHRKSCDSIRKFVWDSCSVHSARSTRVMEWVCVQKELLQ
jgi:hypothetical protein